MIKRTSVFSVATRAYLWMAGLFFACELRAQEGSEEPIRSTLVYQGAEREYFVRLPRDFDGEKLYWLLVAVHGGGGNGRTFFMAESIRTSADSLGLEAIIVSPSFSNEDFNASRFPTLGEGAFLQQVLEQLRGEYRLRPKVLLTGYSRGGQFSHRFALLNPTQVEACAPFAPGTWTTPDGRLLVQSFGEVPDPASFLASPADAKAVPDRLRNLFEPRVAEAAGLQAKAGANGIPFLVMCGTLDPRLDIAKEFARDLKKEGFAVETEWPRTPHRCRDDDRECRDEYKTEFERYSRAAVEFFLSVTERK
jgi:predicted esterase